jgi:plasmid stabilization system protein ParE
VKPVILRPPALQELREAIAWYEARHPKIATAFFVEMGAILSRIGGSPVQFPAWTVNPAFRKAVLPETFPYIVYFREKADRIEVMALSHGARAPGYWMRRRH